jgi:transposase
MLCRRDANRNGQGNWRTPPWTTASAAWHDIDQRLEPDDLARQIHAFVLSLDRQEVERSYLGVGKQAFPPALMLMVVLYEMHTGIDSPSDWAIDCRFFDPVKWLAMGLQPSPSYCYTFRKRLGPMLANWHQQTIDQALAEGRTTGKQASIDGTFVAARGSRHRLTKAKTLTQRLDTLQQALKQDGKSKTPRRQTPATLLPDSSAPPAETACVVSTATADIPPSPSANASGNLSPNATAAAAPYWMAKTPAGRRRQLHRYRQAQMRLDALLAHHAKHETHKAKRKRRTAEQVRVCPSEAEAALGRDKLKTFRPLYNVHLVADLATPLILDYGVHATTTDAGLLIPTLQHLEQTLGQNPDAILVDGIYVSGTNLAYCADHGIMLYAPADARPGTGTKSCPAGAAGNQTGTAAQTSPAASADDKTDAAAQTNSAASAKDKSGAAKKACQIPKDQFRWDAAEETYYCPQGHRLLQIGCTLEKREQEQEVKVYQYRCPAQHCTVCPQAAQCTSAPHKGRTIKRSEHEEKVEALRSRMQTPEGAALYKKRGQSVEPRFGDLKEHRGLTRFGSFGLALALVQVGLLVLVHNGLLLLKPRVQPTPKTEPRPPSMDTPAQPPIPQPSTTWTTHESPALHVLPRPPTLAS